LMLLAIYRGVIAVRADGVKVEGHSDALTHIAAQSCERSRSLKRSR
jgi:hypothetical protein